MKDYASREMLQTSYSSDPASLGSAGQVLPDLGLADPGLAALELAAFGLAAWAGLIQEGQHGMQTVEFNLNGIGAEGGATHIYTYRPDTRPWACQCHAGADRQNRPLACCLFLLQRVGRERERESYTEEERTFANMWDTTKQLRLQTERGNRLNILRITLFVHLQGPSREI
jgi:hypothetical protein